MGGNAYLIAIGEVMENDPLPENIDYEEVDNEKCIDFYLKG